MGHPGRESQLLQKPFTDLTNTEKVFESDKHNFYSGNETWKKKYISNHYNNLICVSITLTNIYLTYKREIIVHIKLMAMAVTYMVQSDRGSSQCRESSCLGARGARWRDGWKRFAVRVVTRWHFVVDRDLLANAHSLTATLAAYGQAPAAVRKEYLNSTARKRQQTQPGCDPDAWVSAELPCAC